MSKTTFEGYVPSLKERHEATIVGGKAIQSKGGSIRYMLQGEYDGRKTLPKTVSKEDFVKVYGFDAKEAESVVILGKNEDSDEVLMLGHAVGKEDRTGFTPKRIATGGSVALIEQTDNHQAETVVGSPSPASVEPPAPSEKPFPQEPSNENFSAEDYGWVITHKDADLRTDSFRTKSQAEKYRDEMKQNKTLRTGLKIVKANSNDEPMALETLNNFSAEPNFIRFIVMKKDDRGTYRPKYYLTKEDTILAGEKPDDTYEHNLDTESWEWFIVKNRIREKYGDFRGPLPSDKTEVKEAFGFGKEDEEEESEEPKTKEYTVVLQEGDKLELTDIAEEEQVAPDDENTEKEAESNQDIKWSDVKEMGNSKCPFCFRSAFRLLDEEGEEFSVYEENLAGDNWLLECSRCKAEWNQYGENTLDGGYTGNAEYEAVQAKVTRIEDEKEDEEESDEGLLTPKNLAIGALGVGALALALGAEDECPSCGGGPFDTDGYGSVKCTECGDTFFESEDESDYWAGEEYGVMNAEGVYEAEVNVGEKRVMSRKDYAIDNDLSGFSNMEVGDIDLDEYEDEITDSVEDEVIEAIRESVDDAMPISDGESISSSVNVDTEIEITVPISGDIDYDWTANETHEDENHDDEWDAEHESESDGYAYAYTKGHNDGINDEVIYRPSITTDKGKNIYKKILKQKAETFEARGTWNLYKSQEKVLKAYRDSGGNEYDCMELPDTVWDKLVSIRNSETLCSDVNRWLNDNPSTNHKPFGGFFAETYEQRQLRERKERTDLVACGGSCGQKYPFNELQMMRGDPNDNWCKPCRKKLFYQLKGADTVGNPSPSGPSSTPEPAEATGSEPSNENFESPTKGNMKLIGGIGLVAAGLFALGKSDWVADVLNKYMK